MTTNVYQQFAIGVDIGGTSTKSGIVNHRGEIVSYGAAVATGRFATPEAFVDELYAALAPSIEKVGAETIKGIGVGAPNGNYYTGTVDYAPNLPWRSVVPVARLVSERFDCPCALTNDANAAALGEMMYGVASGMKDFITIALGTGVGSGIVANGHVLYGHDGFAGELGHTIIRPGGRKHWATNLCGSLEAYCSATGIVLTAKELLSHRGHGSTLHQCNLDELTSKQVYEAAAGGDALAQEVYRYTGQILGEALANFVMFSSPEAIVLFGGVIKAGDLILQPAREHMEKNLLPIFQNKVKLVFSELNEADAAILGASALVWEMKA